MINMIDDRLKSLIKYIDSEDLVIDIGCDHALIDIYLIKNNILNNIIISDISINALNQGILNIKKNKLDNKIDARCGNGLEVLNEFDDINTILISGMGTNTILKILDNKYLNKINKLIIQSNKDYYLLRKEITKLGFMISEEEVIVSNNKMYINIVFIRGNKKYTDIELKYGISNMKNKKIYYEYLINKYQNILLSIQDKDKYTELQNEINILKELMK